MIGLQLWRIDQLLVVMRSRIRIPNHLCTSFTVAEWSILEYLLAFLIQSPAAFMQQNVDKGLNSLHFGSDPTDTRIRISDQSRNPD